MILVHFQDKPFNTTVIQDDTPTTDAEEDDIDQFYDDVKDLLELTPKNDIFFITGLECKSRKARDTQKNRQV